MKNFRCYGLTVPGFALSLSLKCRATTHNSERGVAKSDFFRRSKTADSNIPDSPEEWLDGFSTFSIYRILPELIDLWGLNVQTEIASKKLRSTEREMTAPLHRDGTIPV